MRALSFSLLLACLFFCAPLRASDATTAVWIDTDPSIGPPWREVDDALALLLAFRSPELRIAGLSTTYGNAPLGRTTTVAHDLVRRFGDGALAEQDIFPGAANAAEQGRETAASRALCAALQREPRLTYIALGPLTNLATFYQRHPACARQLERVIVLGGHGRDADLSFTPRGWPRLHDANIFKDPASAAFVLRRARRLTLAPKETYTRLRVSRADWQRIRRGWAGDYLQPRTWGWMWFWTRLVGLEGAPVFDAVPILAAARPDLVPREAAFARVDEEGRLIFSRERQPHATAVQVLPPLGFAAQRVLVSRLSGETEGER